MSDVSKAAPESAVVRSISPVTRAYNKEEEAALEAGNNVVDTAAAAELSAEGIYL